MSEQDVINMVNGLYTCRGSVLGDAPLFVAPIPTLPDDELFIEFYYGKSKLRRIVRDGETIWKEQEPLGWAGVNCD
jgi:hypothetical protein